MERNRDLQNQGSLEIRERALPRSREAFMSQYNSPYEALLELIDNAVDNRIASKLLDIQLRVNRKEISVTNIGGKGLDFNGLDRFFQWGYPEKVGKATIGLYGVGGKAAMGYLGTGMEVICSADGSETQYKVADPNWEVSEGEEWKSFIPEVGKAITIDGFFKVRISSLKREFKKPQVILLLSDKYRPLILGGVIKINVNGDEVPAQPLRYMQDDPFLVPQTYNLHTRWGEDQSIKIRVGVSPDGQDVKPGIRCYFHGRLISDGEFFGLTTPAGLPQMSRFIGEAHLDFVPVTTKKDSFDKGSEEWKEAVKRINFALVQQKWAERMGRLKIEQFTEVEKYEQEIAKRAKKVVDSILGQLKLINKDMLLGSSEGRLPSVPRPTPPPPPTGITRTPGERHGATAPTKVDTVANTIERWGGFDDYRVVSMGNRDVSCEVVTEGNRLILKFNSDYPAYQTEKLAGKAELERYKARTALQEICRRAKENHPTKDYFELYTPHEKRLFEYYQNQLSHREHRKQSGSSSIGSIRFNSS